jgi:NAD(P)-dependent dehydrogenase (short-subunit alcohol dehydrogenase family)
LIYQVSSGQEPPISFSTYPSLEDSTVYITGGASGIGAEIVRGFADQRSITAELRAQGTTSISPPSAHVILSSTPPLFSSTEPHAMTSATGEMSLRTTATNLSPPTFAIEAVAPSMIAVNKGSIINFGSASWLRTVDGIPVYTTVRAGVQGMPRSFARDLGKHRICFNTIVPGWVMTELQDELWATPETLEQARQNQCFPDFIDLVYPARMALFLASDGAAMCIANN